jgi:hypothetical protein
MADPKKTGWHTSEFWLTAAAQLLSLLFLAGAIGDGGLVAQIAALAAMTLTNAGYSVSRGQVKAANAKASAPDTLSATAVVTKE